MSCVRAFAKALAYFVFKNIDTYTQIILICRLEYLSAIFVINHITSETYHPVP